MCARIPLAMILVFVEYFHLAPLTFLLTFSGPFILLLSFLGLLWVITTALASKGRFYIAFSFHFLLSQKVRVRRLLLVSGRIIRLWFVLGIGPRITATAAMAIATGATVRTTASEKSRISKGKEVAAKNVLKNMLTEVFIVVVIIIVDILPIILRFMGVKLPSLFWLRQNLKEFRNLYRAYGIFSRILYLGILSCFAVYFYFLDIHLALVIEQPNFRIPNPQHLQRNFCFDFFNDSENTFWGFFEI